MATRYVQQATSQLAPGYTQQINAYQSQIPAIQQLYQSLVQGLQSQQQQGNQSILEDASSRGLLHSTIPVEGQTQLGQQIIGQQGQYAQQEAQSLGQLNTQIAGVRTDQASAIAQLANSLQQSALGQQQLTFQKQQANRDYALQKQVAKQGYQLNLASASKGY